ncbi:MAG TPA: phosphohydrolase [Armatimonadetes bacterium]|nr:phosphohydrolase [Armatimonadota bacterium]
MDRLTAQLTFLAEIDRLKGVLRQTRALAGERHENSAEHSWHLALMALTLAEHADEPVDLERVVRMVLVHDLVEIEAGDTFVYDTAVRDAQAASEAAAAERLFGLLPPDQAAEFRALWDDFESFASPESRYAKALDRLNPILLNLASGGLAWLDHGVTLEQALAVNRPIAEASATLWEVAQAALREAERRGYLAG